MVIVFLSCLLLAFIWRCHVLTVRIGVLKKEVLSQDELKKAVEDLSTYAMDKASKEAKKEANLELGEGREIIEKALFRLEREIRTLEQERKTDHGMVRQQIDALLRSEQLLRSETVNLSKALKAPASRGKWGELQLRRIVELAGMVNYCDFFEQSSELGSDTRLKPDMIIRLPGERQVIIDAKVPLSAYLDAFNEEEKNREDLLIEHAKQLKAHVQILGKKSYWEHFQPSPEFVILFLPSESMFGAALEKDPSLLEMSVKEGVVIATPTTLIGLLKAVAHGWKQERVSRHAESVSLLGHELYKRLVDFQSHWSRMGRALGGAVEAYNRATGSLESRVMVTARKFQEMGAAASTIELPKSPFVEAPTTMELSSEEPLP